jgi:carboxypeptidase family protein
VIAALLALVALDGALGVAPAPVQPASMRAQLCPQGPAPQEQSDPAVDPGLKPAAAASVQGRVLRPDGRPLPRATVRVSRIGLPPRLCTTATDLDGAYAFANLLPGSYRIVANKDGFIQMQVGQHAVSEEVDPLTLRPGESREGVDLVLPRHSAIAGRIFDENGDPVEGALVRAQRVEYIEGRYRLSDVFGGRGRLTNDQGRFRVFGLPPGKFVLSAMVGLIDYPGPGMMNLPGYAPTFYPGTAALAEATFISVALSQDVTGIDFPLVAVRTAQVSGRAVMSDNEPVGGSLTLRPSARSRGIAPATGARIERDGTFTFPNVAPGEYVIELSAGRQNAFREGEFAARIVTVNGEDVTGLLIKGSRGSAISGRITLEGGSADREAFAIEPAPADFDFAPSNGGAIARAEIKEDWTFQLTGVNGPRRFRLREAPAGWALKMVRVNGSDVTDSVLSFGASAESLSDVEIVLTRSFGGITGIARDASGQPAIEYTVIAYSTDPQLWYHDSRFVAHATARDGRFTVPGLPPGDYYCVAVPRVRGDEWEDPAVLEALALRATRQSIAEGQSVAVTLTLGRIER